MIITTVNHNAIGNIAIAILIKDVQPFATAVAKPDISSDSRATDPPDIVTCVRKGRAAHHKASATFLIFLNIANTKWYKIYQINFWFIDIVQSINFFYKKSRTKKSRVRPTHKKGFMQ